MPRKRVVSRTVHINILEVVVYDTYTKSIFRTCLYSPKEYGKDLNKLNQFTHATFQLRNHHTITEIIAIEPATGTLAMPEHEFFTHAKLTSFKYC